MDAAALRYLYGYHFAENRKIWDRCVNELTVDQFTQNVDYSHGSARNQLIHIMSVDDVWFSALRGVELPQPFTPAASDDCVSIRAQWDTVEQNMRAYLAALRDDMLFTKPFAEGEDKDLILWQVLIHVVNHATDHRAQVLRQLHDLGVKTGPQDYIFYVYDHP